MAAARIEIDQVDRAFAVHRHAGTVAARAAARPRATTGICGGSGTIVYFYATQHGYLAITAVLTSLYPAITIVLARVVLGERLTPLRLASLVLAGACVALIAVGGAG